MFNAVNSWQIAPLLSILAAAGLVAMAAGLNRQIKDAWIYIGGAYFITTYVLSNIFLILVKVSFLTLLLSQIAATLIFYTIIYLIDLRLHLNRLEIREYTFARTTLICAIFILGALALCWFGSTVPGRCSGSRCNFYYALIGRNMDFARYYLATSLGSMLIISSATLISAKFKATTLNNIER